MNTGTFSIPRKVRWSVLKCNINFVSIDFSGCFNFTIQFIFMLSTAKEGYSNHAVNNIVMTFIILIDP